MASDELGRVPEVANLGIFRPPLIYLAAILLGVSLHLAWPVELGRDGVVRPIGGLVIALAVALFVWAVRTFRSAGTPIPGNLPTTTIVRAGPYRWSRNPIYVAFSVLVLGVALAANSVWPLVTLVPAVALMSFVVIPREERYLESRFPEDYPRYKRSVRRWV